MVFPVQAASRTALCGHEVVLVLVVEDGHHQVKPVVEGDEVVLETDAADVGIDRIGRHQAFIQDHGLAAQGPFAVEETVREDVKIPFRAVIPSVDDVAFGNAGHESSALAAVLDGFLDIEDVLEGDVGHAHHPQDFGRGDVGKVVPDAGQHKAFRTTLIELCQALFQLAVHEQAEIHGTGADGIAGLVFFGPGNDIRIALMADEPVIGEGFVDILVKGHPYAEPGTQDQ